MSEFSNTDGELARCIKARMRHELQQFPHTEESKQIVREYLTELASYIEEYVTESIDNDDNVVTSAGFVTDIVNQALRVVDFDEIAKAYIDEVELEEDGE